jgi:L-threonylcarbamoyladenylate synthase
MMPQVHVISAQRPQPDIIAAAAAVMRGNGVVILPTRGLYGLGANTDSAAAVGRVFEIKNRPPDKPLPVLIGHLRMLSHLVADVPPMATSFMDAFWPGKVTLIMQARKGLPDGLCSSTGKVGVRLVGHPVASALVNALGCPITGTSANLSGSGGSCQVDAIDKQVMASVEMVLDAGVLDGGPGSTVIDVTGEAPEILRQGAVTAATVMAAFETFDAK